MSSDPRGPLPGPTELGALQAPLHVLAVSREAIPHATLREALGERADAALMVDRVDDLRDVPAVLAEGAHDVLVIDSRVDPRAVLRLVEAASRSQHHPPILFLPPPPPGARAPAAEGQERARARPPVDLVEEVFRHALDASSTRRELRASQSRFEALAEASAQGVMVIDGDGRVRLVNPAVERQLGLRGADPVGADADDVLAGLSRADGAPFADDEHPLRLARWHSWSFVETPVRVRCREGGEARLLLRAQRLPGVENGGGRALLLLFTEPGAETVPALAADGVDAAHAGKLAHDLNNLLHTIQGYAELMAMGFPGNDPRRAHLDSLHHAVERATDVTRRLRTSGARAALPLAAIDLDAYLSTMQPLLQHLLGDRIRLDLALDLGGATLRLDRGQLEQAIMNLALNARDAMELGGGLRVATSVVELDEAFVRDHPGARPGRYARLTVTDSGCGMDPATCRRVFEPFFTTKPRDRGSGLGLSMVYGFVKQCGGYIGVDSAPGAGSTFALHLPLA